MAKALKVAAVVAGVAALAVVTGGAALGLGVALSTTALGVSASTLLLVSGGLSAGAALLTKTPKVPQSQVDRLFANIDPRAFRKDVFGQTALPIDVRYEEWSGKDQEYCDWIVCFASHAIDGLEEIWFNTEMAWSTTTGVVGKYAGYFSLPNLVLEGSPGTAFSFASGRWGGQARLTGCAYARFRFKTTGNGKKAESPFASGIPSRITAIGRGAKLYDPRRDSTVPGGSGPMRWNDQSTWRYTADDGAVIGENLALHVLRRVLGWRIRNPATGEMRLATGSGVPGRRLNLQSFIVAANLADELVNRSAGGTEPRYHGAAVVSEGDDPKTTLDMLCAACCGRFRDTGGRLSLVIAHNDLAAAASDEGLLDDDVIGGFTWDPDPALEATPNIVRGRYVDATTASLYQLIDYPEIRIASPDGQDRVYPLDLAAVESPSHAQRVAKQVLQRLQYQREFAAPFDIRAWKYGVGDLVPFTFAALGFDRVLFRVKEQELGQGGSCQMTLKIEHASIYAWDRDDAAPVMAADPIVYDNRNNPLILAINDAATTAEWPNIADPAGTRPDDNATNSANPDSAFGPGGTVGATIDRLSDFDRALAAAKARQDQLDTVIIPAIGDAVADASVRISAAQARADKAVADADAVDRRVDAFVAEGGYDDTDVRSQIRTVATVAANANQGVADLSTSVGASFRGVSDTLANYDERITTLATGSDSFASRASALEASSRADTAMLNGNANFSDWPDARGSVPSGWGLTTAAPGATADRVTGLLGRYALQTAWPGSDYPADFFYAVSGLDFGDPYGGVDPGMVTGPGWYVMEADVTLVSGSLVGSGIYCAAYGADGVGLGIGSAAFTAHPANGGAAPGAGQPGVRYRFAVLLDFTDPHVRSLRFHPMPAWNAFAASTPAKVLNWHKAGVRAATSEEIAARRADTNATSALARVSATEDALADLPNRYAAASRTATLEAQVNFAADSGLQRTINSRIEDRATVIADGKLGAANQRMDVMVSEYNGIGARVEQQAGTIAGLNGKAAAYVRIIADAGNGRASLSLWSDQYGGAWSLGGNGLIDGNLTITGTLTARTMDYGSVGEMSIYYDTTSQSFNSQTSWIDIATLALTSRQGQPIEGFFTCILTNLGGTSTQVQARVVRLEDGTPIWGGSGGILIAARDEGESMTASFFDSLGAGTTGTYAVQMKKRAGASNTVSAAYRSMRLVEMSRNKFQQIVINTPAGEGPGRGTYGGGSINGGGYGLGNFNLQ